VKAYLGTPQANLTPPLQNKSLSSDPDPALALQGIGWLTRKAIGLATVTLHVKQYTGPPSEPANPSGPAVTHVDIDQTATGGVKGSTELRCFDNEFRPHSDWLFGNVRGQSRWIAAEEIKDPFLAKGPWLEGDEEKAGPNGETHMLSYVESLDNGWTATQIWGFKIINGERKYVRNILIAKGDKRVELVMVYDYVQQ
jgi:hypothetical protein